MKYFLVLVLSITALNACDSAEARKSRKIAAEVQVLEENIIPIRIGNTDDCLLTVYDEQGKTALSIDRSFPRVPCHQVRWQYAILATQPTPAAMPLTAAVSATTEQTRIATMFRNLLQ